MTLILRDYQQETVDLILANIEKDVPKQLINSPTGSGKTVIASVLVDELVKKDKKVFFVVANEPLVMQTYNKFVGINLFPSIIKAGFEKYYNPYAKVQIVMIQSFTARIDKMPDDINPDVIIIDEVDYGFNGQMLKKLVEKYHNAKIIGLTGTPITFKGHLLPGFDFYHEVITVRELQQLGFLSFDKNYIPASPDVSNVRVMTTGEFNEHELDETCSQSYFIDDIVKTYKKVDCGYRAIGFAISISHGEKLQEAFCHAGIKTGLVHSKMKKFQVDYWMQAHKRGSIQLLLNVGKLTRGYDDVDIIDNLMMRPTMSEALYQQMVGRTARLDAMGKRFFRHFDYAGNIERFGLWSEPRLYSPDTGVKKEVDYRPIVCPSCFAVIYERSGNKCPECDFILSAQQEKREREIAETLRAKEIIEIKSETGSEGAINALTNLLGKNGNTFYYTKLLSMKPQNIPQDTFNSEVIRLANYTRRKGYNPNYVYHKMREKISVLATIN